MAKEERNKEERERYRAKPEVRAHIKMQQKLYRSQPEIKEARKVYSAKRWADPEISARMVAKRNENRERYLRLSRERSARPDYVLRRKES